VKCRDENLEFLGCKAADENPAKCLVEGAAVQSCVSNLLTQLSDACPEQFARYSKCIEDHPMELYAFNACRWNEKKLAQCAVKALDIENEAKAAKTEQFVPPKCNPPIQGGPQQAKVTANSVAESS